MSDLNERMIAQVQSKPPRCLEGFRATTAPQEEWPEHVDWALGCQCGAERGSILGYSLRDVMPDYHGTEVFVSPMAFLCSACGATTELIDTAKHGYNSEISTMEESSDATVRRTGERKKFACPGCQGETFSVKTTFGHSHFDLIEDEPDLEPRAQDFFDSFNCRGQCEKCGQWADFASFELA